MKVVRYYRQPGCSVAGLEKLMQKLQRLAGDSFQITNIQSELCIYVQLNSEKGALSVNEERHLQWIIGIPFEYENLSTESFLEKIKDNSTVVLEFGPRLNFSTAFSTNAVSICHSAGLGFIERVEQSIRYCISLHGGVNKDVTSLATFTNEVLAPALHDRMTQCRYERPLTTFRLDVNPEPVYEVDVMGEGRSALVTVNTELGLAFDEWDLDYYTDLFKTKMLRNPTSVECFDLAQSNSEHCRHWFFRGRLVIDGIECDRSLLRMVMDTQASSNQNNVIKFNDNSSGIKGYRVSALCPMEPSTASCFEIKDDERHIIFTAETHNFPTGVAPFSGATTGTGGRIRDVQATGRGAHVIAGTAGYSFGNLCIPDYNLPWEDKTLPYPLNLARPLDIAIDASNGASDYGNKFGEPVVAGFARSFGLIVPGSCEGERREWIKPIMFTGGIGSISDVHVQKQEASIGMDVVKVGGPVYRIGVGGGAASSVGVQGDNKSDLDFGAVQRGDPEMEQKMNRVIRACIELKNKNIICSIHDQGAGGNGNVLKELCYPAGSLIQVAEFQLGDPTLSVLEVWGAEYQESNALLVRAEDGTLLRQIALREKCPVSFVGVITGDQKIRLLDNRTASVGGEPCWKRQKIGDKTFPVDLDLELVLGDMPRKVFTDSRVPLSLSDICLPDGEKIRDILDRVLRLPSVASKRYLTNKVDRSVTGLIAQQQCVGPLHTPLADVAVIALSHFDTVGAATAIGEQPIKGLVDAGCGARMTIAEALTNLVFARISSLKDVKCSGNWMWPAKMPGEGARLYDACTAVCDVMAKLGVAVDGGKDSLSMTTRLGSGDNVVKAPGCLVVSVYAPCPDIMATVTPDLKCLDGSGVLLYVEMSPGKHRLGGSALAQCYKQLGKTAPDLDSPEHFVIAFNVTQQLIHDGLLLSGHDVSDGGLITCLLEMAFAGNCSIDAEFVTTETVSPIDFLFAEELGLLVEVAAGSETSVVAAYAEGGVSCRWIGRCYDSKTIHQTCVVRVNGAEVLSEETSVLRDIWEETSFRLECLQSNPSCVQEEQIGLRSRHAPRYHLSFDPASSSATLDQDHAPIEDSSNLNQRPKVAVIREEGSNGDREMAAALQMAGFEAWDVNMQDLKTGGAVTLADFRGIVFVGGFSYADVFGSAKGWAAALRFDDHIRREFDDFRRRDDTFSLGVCNGCQLLALLGWVGVDEDNKENGDFQGVLLTHNSSERFESRFVTVRVEQSPAMMLAGMQDSVLGVWVAHGEGRVVFKNPEIFELTRNNNLVSLRYADDNGSATTTYPLNPNGSADGIAALCSLDGRHLAMMPHPERCVRMWQWPWVPGTWKQTVTVSPWLRMFQNAFDWCCQNSADAASI